MAAPAPTAAFVMQGSRDALEAGLGHIEEQVRSIERAVVENPAYAFDLARTLVESVCQTILSERKVGFSDKDTLPKLFKAACNCLPFLPPESSGESGVRESLAQTVKGLSTAIQGICQLRNDCGFASHGSGQPRPMMETVQALMAAEAADTIVGFLHRVHRQDRTPQSPRELYDANQAFNDWVDEAHGPVCILGSEFRASEVLYQMEPESYRIHATEFNGDAVGIAGGRVAEMEATP